MLEIELSEEELQREAADKRKVQLVEKFDKDSRQGILPLTNDRFYEQSNPIVRSAIFTASKISHKEVRQFTEWTNMFSMGSGAIQYRGPVLTIDHETVWVRLVALARGRSVFDSVISTQADILRWLGLDPNSGANYVKARRILEDLGSAELRISSRPALQRILDILKSPTVPDADFKRLVTKQYAAHAQMIDDALRKNEHVYINLRFFGTVTINQTSKRLVINLDPLTTLFFDGINTTLVPFEVLDEVDRLCKKILPFIASHRDGVFATRLEKFHEFTGSISNYETVKRRFKSQLKKTFTELEAKGYIEPGWDISQNREGDEIVSGLKLGEALRVRSRLELQSMTLSASEQDRGSDEAIKERLEEFAEQQGFNLQVAKA